MTLRLHLFLLIFFNQLICLLSQQETGFVYNGFRQAQADLHLDGASTILLPDGLLQLTNASKQQMGHAFFKQPFKFNSSEKLSFWTHFVCALVPKPGADGGHGIAFVVAPSIDLTQADPTQYLGLFNISTNGSPSSKLLAVELDTAESAEFDDIDKNHVGIDINKLPSVESASASYFSNTKGKNQSLTLLSGDPIQVWVDYEDCILNVTLAPLRIQKPSHPLLSRSINLTEIFPDQRLFVGFSASTGSLISYQYILGWSFSRSRVIFQSLDFSKLPQVPHPRDKKQKETSALLTALLMLLIFILLVILGGVYLYRRNKYAEVREDWEKEYGPHRFSYESLYKATKGFDKDGRLGKGGFGEVYKGNLPQIGDIAMKRVSHDAKQGMKQFVAEVVTMGSLKHRNLVPLLGYCRRKRELLLVSKFMPNGSLDRYLFHREKPVLSWPQRLKILKDIASALSYLHTGANQVVLHRVIKSSNVMLDAEFNGRLGDFGMAKFQENGDSLSATAAVGTMGYIASEITTMGASTRTDVYAFGAFMLEVTCGRRPLDPKMAAEKRHLIKWVCECWRMDSLVDVRDARLGGNFSKEEIEMVLKLGLLCTNVIEESRPSMEQVVQYINQSLPLPHFSPDSPGTGVPTPAFLETAYMAITSISRSTLAPSTSLPSPNNSMFVTHTITWRWTIKSENFLSSS